MIGAATGFALLYAERLPTHPWDQLLAFGVLATVAAMPIGVKIGSRLQSKRTERLRRTFGEDYERAVNEHGNWRKAEAVLMQRLRAQTRAGQAADSAEPPR